MKKKILAFTLVIAMLAIAIVGGTMAYFTDSAQVTNAFGVAGLDISLSETVNHVDGAGNPKAMLNGNDEVTGPQNVAGIQYQNIMPGDVMSKVVTVKNEEEYPAYVALAIQHTHWQNFNANIDGVYENAPHNYDAVAMQQVTDDIFTGTGWNGLSYDKETNGFGIRYYPANVSPVDQDGSESYVGNTSTAPIVLAVDYTVMQKTNTFDVGYTENLMKYTRKEGNSSNDTAYNNYIRFGLTDNCRMWVYYLYLPAGASYTLDLSVTCPTYITSENIAAFDNMAVDVQATAIQVDGFATAKEAFLELNKTFGFDF